MSLLDSINKAAEKTKKNTQQGASAVASSPIDSKDAAFSKKAIMVASIAIAVALGSYFGLNAANQTLTPSQGPQVSESAYGASSSQTIQPHAPAQNTLPPPSFSSSHAQIAKREVGADSSQGSEQCDLMLAAGKLKLASHCLLDYLKKNPTDDKQHYKLALIFGEMGMKSERQKALENAYAIDPTNESYLVSLANTYFDTKQYSKLSNILKDALEQQDLSSEVLAEILALAGKARMDFQTDDAACQLLSKSVELDPDADNAYALGVCYEIVGYKKGAIRAYQQALNLASSGGEHSGFRIPDLEGHLKQLTK
ncbi:hypothetical protein D6779_06340 [Candidatus Parcubacteria bacterium]|nr:MAG: hypothetical protein D6779_06340 [Candidatus Parcubacteria bacterium]